MMQSVHFKFLRVQFAAGCTNVGVTPNNADIDPNIQLWVFVFDFSSLVSKECCSGLSFRAFGLLDFAN